MYCFILVADVTPRWTLWVRGVLKAWPWKFPGGILGLGAFTAVAWVQLLVGETEILKALQRGQKKKKRLVLFRNCCESVIHSVNMASFVRSFAFCLVLMDTECVHCQWIDFSALYQELSAVGQRGCWIIHLKMIAIKCSLPKGCVLCYYCRGFILGSIKRMVQEEHPLLWGVLLHVHLVCCSGQVRSPHFFLCNIELVVLCNACVDLWHQVKTSNYWLPSTDIPRRYFGFGFRPKVLVFHCLWKLQDVYTIPVCYA